jgi:hypothetical protein
VLHFLYRRNISEIFDESNAKVYNLGMKQMEKVAHFFGGKFPSNTNFVLYQM